MIAGSVVSPGISRGVDGRCVGAIVERHVRRRGVEQVEAEARGARIRCRSEADVRLVRPEGERADVGLFDGRTEVGAGVKVLGDGTAGRAGQTTGPFVCRLSRGVGRRIVAGPGPTVDGAQRAIDTESRNVRNRAGLIRAQIVRHVFLPEAELGVVLCQSLCGKV